MSIDFIASVYELFDNPSYLHGTNSLERDIHSYNESNTSILLSRTCNTFINGNNFFWNYLILEERTFDLLQVY